MSAKSKRDETYWLLKVLLVPLNLQHYCCASWEDFQNFRFPWSNSLLPRDRKAKEIHFLYAWYATMT
jgi:hypothetical protein